MYAELPPINQISPNHRINSQPSEFTSNHNKQEPLNLLASVVCQRENFVNSFCNNNSNFSESLNSNSDQKRKQNLLCPNQHDSNSLPPLKIILPPINKINKKFNCPTSDPFQYSIMKSNMLDKILLSNLVLILSRNNSLTIALEMIKTQLWSKLSSSIPFSLSTIDGNTFTTEKEFEVFKSQIPDETLQLLINDLQILVNCFSTILDKRKTKFAFNDNYNLKIKVPIPQPIPKQQMLNKFKNKAYGKQNLNSSKNVIKKPLKKSTSSRSFKFKPAPSELSNSECQHCGMKNTPEWRRGPDGSRCLCNACGLFYSKLHRKFGYKDACEIMKLRKDSGNKLNRKVVLKSNEMK